MGSNHRKRTIIDEELTKIVRFVDKENSRMMELEASLKRITTGDIHHIHCATGFDDFIVGGSWVSMLINKSIGLMFENDETFEAIEVKSNNKDICYGQFTDEAGEKM